MNLRNSLGISLLILATMLFVSFFSYAYGQSIIATIPVGKTPSGIAYDSGKGEVFVTNADDNTVSVISDNTNAVIDTIPAVGGNPGDIAYDFNKNEMFVGNSVTVSVISDSTNAVIDTIPLESTAGGLAYDWARGEVFAVNQLTGAVFVISDSTNAVIAKVHGVGDRPNQIVYDSGKGEIFVTNGFGLPVISDATNTVIGTAVSNGSAQEVTYDSGKGEILVTNGFNSVSVISDSNNTLIGTLDGGSFPLYTAYDSGKGEIFVTNWRNQTVSVISDSLIQTPQSGQSSPTGSPVSTSSQLTYNIPSWVKNTAGWWATGQVGDADFIKGIQYLIQQNIMTIPQTTQSGSSSSQQIPAWVKNNAGWWATGQISDGEFVKGIQYLVSSGIIQIS